jgi:paired amphipathic helix protein Sin3a
MTEPVAGPSAVAQPEPADVVVTESPPLVHPRPIVGKALPDRPLNQKDALSYLNAVKVQFQHKPDVYDLFLDIMKDFKGQL